MLIYLSRESIVGGLKKGPMDQYLNDARGNSHKKALLYAASASIRRDEDIATEYMQVNSINLNILMITINLSTFRKPINIYWQLKKKIVYTFGTIKIRRAKNHLPQLYLDQ